MKTFCQKCGKPLNDSRICSDCGFENQVVNTRDWVKKIIWALGIAVIIFIVAIIFKDKLVFYYENMTEKWKDDFEIAFNDYQSSGCPLESCSMKYSASSFYDKYEREIKEYGDTEREGNRLRMLSKPEEDIFKNTNYVADLIYCNANDEAFIKCQDYKKNINQSLSRNCEDCSQKISKLYEIASTVKDADKASKLFGLIDLLRQQQSISSSEIFAEAPKFIFEQVYCIANNNRVMELGNKDPEYIGMMNHLIAREKCFSKLDESEKQLDQATNQISENLTKINDYTAMLNGDIGMNLKTWSRHTVAEYE